jgi:hypothetical protein
MPALSPRSLRVVAGFHTGDRPRCARDVGVKTDAHPSFFPC